MTTLKNWLLDIFFPRHCLGCNVLLRENKLSYLCQHCQAAIKFKNDFACAFCRSPVKNGKTCQFCIKDHFLDRLLVSTSYENPLAEKSLKMMKYRFIAMLAGDIAGFMVKYMQNSLIKKLGIETGTVVVPVPLHRERLNWRGFNQSELIAVKIADNFEWPLVTNELKRVRANKPQIEMPDRNSRIKNMKNIFQYAPARVGSPDIKGKTILLIDDISTTGSTLDDCARALKGAGAKKVIGFVFARNKI
ncbi:MAG: ComF family protein [Candidatus Yanofskybacteria bacterium]|nr:ComF family protein [Candidatus Yanofskybacteria bacterium]